MSFTSAKALRWSIFPIIFEQWNNHYISNYRKTFLQKSLSSDVNHSRIASYSVTA